MIKESDLKTKKLTKKHRELLANTTISEDFMTLIDSVRFEDAFCANTFNILKKYLKFDICGLFFNDSNELAINVFNLALPNKNITLELTEEIRDKFFDEMEKYKRIMEIQCNLIDGDISDSSKIKYKSLKTTKIYPFFYAEKFIGGFYFGSQSKLDPTEKLYFDLIIKQLESIFKLKYLIHEQQKHALLDPMTGLYNRQEFDHAFEFEFIKARRYIYNFTLAILDIDHFSKINDEHGKAYGDFILTELSDLLRHVFRRTDPIYRYGGEEIIVMLPFTPITKAIIPIERLRSAIADYTFDKDGIKTNLTVSVGLCANYSKFTEDNQMIEALGAALVRAKEGGRNKVEIVE